MPPPKGRNPNRLKPGSSIKVEPIRIKTAIENIKKILPDNPRNLCLFTLGMNTDVSHRTEKENAMSPSSTDIASREQFESCIATFRTRLPDWDAFADARVEGYRRAQMRYIGSGASGKADANALPAQHFTLSVMHVPVGQGNAAHTHEVEEVFFVLQGHMTVFMQDEHGHREETVLGPWDCVSCPAGVVHGFHNHGLEPVYMQVMLGKAAPDLMSYSDPDLQQQRDVHLT